MDWRPIESVPLPSNLAQCGRCGEMAAAYHFVSRTGFGFECPRCGCDRTPTRPYAATNLPAR
jgi:hypothetical protein